MFLRETIRYTYQLHFKIGILDCDDTTSFTQLPKKVIIMSEMIIHVTTIYRKQLINVTPVFW